MKNFKRNVYRYIDDFKCDLAGTASITEIPVTGLTWTTTVSNPCNSTPWIINNANLTVRYEISNSSNCGGTCSDTQAGTATATITVGTSDVLMNLDFDGIGELEDPNFEFIKFILDDVQVADAHATGGKKGCLMGPVTKTYNVASPYFLGANTTHTLFVDFTTSDSLFHVGAYYEINLSFVEIQ